ncbi:MAG: DUF1028 domain-containing protein [Saprospirales bacterium]|nr:DUF1028 domain-containing protein [Saprospirales bacterium]
MKRLLFIFISFCLINNIMSRQLFSKEPFAHTFSIVARDEKTGEIAVGVQSHWFSVGTVVSWAQAGVGAVATQSFVNVSFGVRGLELLKQGKTPQEALNILLADDAGKEVRQVAIIDTFGNVATHTGQKCIQFADHKNGQNFSVQANMMLTDKVVPAMEKSWLENAGKPLAERIIEVMKAAQKAGGDIRGKQSASLIVVRPRSNGNSWEDRLIDLRVDDHKEPIKELERLLKTFRAYEFMNQGDLFAEKNDMKAAMEAYKSAMKLLPSNLEMQYWTAITLANNKRVSEAAVLLQKIYAKDQNWRELTKRLAPCGLLTVTTKELQQLIK